MDVEMCFGFDTPSNASTTIRVTQGGLMDENDVTPLRVCALRCCVYTVCIIWSSSRGSRKLTITVLRYRIDSSSGIKVRSFVLHVV